MQTCTENIRDLQYGKFQYLPNQKKLDWLIKSNVQHKELEIFW